MVKIPTVTDETNLRQGDYSIMRVFEDTLVINYSNIRSPPQIFCIRFKEVLENGQSIE